jgi:uncharacterized membrane protein
MAEELSGESKVFAAIAYFFGTLIALVIYLVKKDDKYVKFHAMQAILFDIALMVVSIPLILLVFAGFFVMAASKSGTVFLVLWAVIMGFSLLSVLAKLIFAFKAFTGSRFKLPIIGKHAQKIAAG